MIQKDWALTLKLLFCLTSTLNPFFYKEKEYQDVNSKRLLQFFQISFTVPSFKNKLQHASGLRFLTSTPNPFSYKEKGNPNSEN